MTLTRGWGPFGAEPSGQFNFELETPPTVLYFEDSPRWVRVEFNGEIVADSRRVKLLHESDHLPVYYFPHADVRSDLFEPTDHRTRCHHKGEASHWSVRVGDRVAENALWRYRDPVAGAPPLGDYVAFHWDAMDAWYEEGEEVFVHPRDPYHRVDVLSARRGVRIMAGEERIATSDAPLLVFETGLPVRHYIPPEDVRMDLLTPSRTRTRCPYKGTAGRYWSIGSGESELTDVAWSYDDPLPSVAPVAGHVAFDNSRVTIEVDDA